MIDHVSLQVPDLAAATEFYEAVLETIGHSLLVARARTVGFGKRYPELWLNHRPGRPAITEGFGAHVALRAPSVKAVRRFHEAALAHGALCDGPPGHRPQYHEGYYAAFVRDPWDNRIEAVTFLSGDQT